MAETLVHRGPDSSGLYAEPNLGLGIRRLKIIDLATGDQPIANEDGSVVMVCNGEIFNYRELRDELIARGHVFRTRTDVEVLVHLYEELGPGLVHRLNGQFAFAVYDSPRRRLLLARDPFGVNPLFYARFDDLLLFGSEVKAILRHPQAERRLDLVGLDQVLSFPGLVSPRTAFAGVESLRPGHTLLAADGTLTLTEYWDLDYPELAAGEAEAEPREEPYVERLGELFTRSVERRLLADVPVGLFISGGLDSSLVAAAVARLTPEVERHSFSIAFADQEIDETRYQRMMTRAIGSRHHEIHFEAESIAGLLRTMVRHCECPVKETFDTCNLALSAAARDAGIKVVLAGQGADELFGGYPGYRFDGLDAHSGAEGVEAALEAELAEELWGDSRLFYEKDQIPFRETKLALYSSAVGERFEEIDCLHHPLVNRERLRNRHPLHQRSYLDMKLRLADHLLSDHGDRMVMASSVEGRYPFLDVELVDFVRTIPPGLKVKKLTEKYIVKQMARGLIPDPIIEREKFGFRAPGSSLLLQHRVAWVEEMLSSETVRQRGVFNPGTVETLRRQYARPGHRLHPHLDTDFLMVVLTTHLLFEEFALTGIA